MHIRLKGVTALAAAAVAAHWLAAIPTAGQTPSSELFPPYRAPRTADGKPNLNGIWQSFTTANWDILAHAAQPGPHPELMGAWGAGPGGQSIVEGNEIPYQPWSAAKQKSPSSKMRRSSTASWLTCTCWLQGMDPGPRQGGMPVPGS